MLYCQQQCVNVNQSGKCGLYNHQGYNIFGKNCCYYHQGMTMDPADNEIKFLDVTAAATDCSPINHLSTPY